MPDELVGEDTEEECVDGRLVVVSDTEEDSVDGRLVLVVVSAKEEEVDWSLAAVYATEVEDSKDGRLVVGFDTDGDSVEGELVVDWEGGTNVVERLFVVSSIVVED